MLEREKHRSVFDKLPTFSSPLADHAQTVSHSPTHDSDQSHPDDLPRFKRYNEPTLLEIFYDLFFAATYNIYCDNKTITNHATFKASIGYFCLLWLTWFVVTLFDVRYATDSIFARLTRAIQLGVLVGFVVVAPKFDPTAQDLATMRAMSLILLCSRACVAIEYGSVLWQVRRHMKARLPLFLQCILHAAAATIYLGITFRFTGDRNSRAFMVWYFVSGAEAIAALLLSNFSPVLSLTDTHLMKRMVLLTIMILGEGIESLAKKVVTIVKARDAWDPVTIGHVTAASATIYFVFLVYFDWLGTSFQMRALRQQLWTSLHLPLHLALVIFMQGFTQFLIWGKIVTQIKRAIDIADPTDDVLVVNRAATSLHVCNQLNQSAQAFFRDYPAKISNTWDTVNDALVNISRIPDNFWPTLSNYVANPDNDVTSLARDVFDNLTTLRDSTSTLAVSMTNAVFGAFGSSLEGDIISKNPDAIKDVKGGGFQFAVDDRNWSRYGLVFAYGYIGAGCTTLFMLVLRAISRDIRCGIWAIGRLIAIGFLAIGTALVSVIWFNKGNEYRFLNSPWVLPAIAFVWAAILFITHTRGEADYHSGGAPPHTR